MVLLVMMRAQFLLVLLLAPQLLRIHVQVLPVWLQLILTIPPLLWLVPVLALRRARHEGLL